MLSMFFKCQFIYLIKKIIKIKKQLSQKSKEKTHINKTKTWATFTYYGEFMRSVTNIFKNSTI